MNRSIKLTAFACAALAVGGFFGARLVATTRAAPNAPAPASAWSGATASARELAVPHLEGSIALDGDLDDPAWTRSVARTGDFFAPNGEAARPSSNAKVVWGDGHLYLALYAADEDVRAAKRTPDGPVYLDDAFHFEFTSNGETRAFDMNAQGVVTDALRRGASGAYDYTWNSGAHVSTELDGTPNDPSDDDEEWSLEIAIPLESLGLEGKPGERIGFSVRRCDTPKGGARSCGAWPESDARGELVLQ